MGQFTYLVLELWIKKGFTEKKQGNRKGGGGGSKKRPETDEIRTTLVDHVIVKGLKPKPLLPCSPSPGHGRGLSRHSHCSGTECAVLGVLEFWEMEA